MDSIEEGYFYAETWKGPISEMKNERIKLGKKIWKGLSRNVHRRDMNVKVKVI